MSLTDATPLAIAGFVSIAISLTFLVIGIQKARTRQLKQHKFFMLAATSTNTIFLVLYITRLTIEGSTEFAGPDLIFRLVYLPILTVHIIFALVSIYFVARQIYMGLKHASSSENGTPMFRGKYRQEHISRGNRGAMIWGSSFVGGISIFFLLYIFY